jgi:hypothetical protein
VVAGSNPVSPTVFVQANDGFICKPDVLCIGHLIALSNSAGNGEQRRMESSIPGVSAAMMGTSLLVWHCWAAITHMLLAVRGSAKQDRVV